MLNYVNRVNFGKSVLAGRALVSLTRAQLAASAKLGQDTVARIEDADPAVSLNSMAAIQRTLEHAGIEFCEGTQRAAVALRRMKISECAICADPSLPTGTRFIEPRPA